MTGRGSSRRRRRRSIARTSAAPNDSPGAILKMWARPTSARAAGCGSNTTTSSARTPRSCPGGDAAVVRIERQTEGHRPLGRCDAALCRGRSVRRRQAGGRRMLAQPDRGRRRAARRHRQSQFRQSRAARDHGPARRLHQAASARPAGRSTFPVVSGNVSLYNETNGTAILPTPTIGGVGLLDDCHAWRRSPSRRRATRSS